MTAYILGIPTLGDWMPQLTTLSEEEAADIVEYSSPTDEFHFTIIEVEPSGAGVETAGCSLNHPCGGCRFCQGPGWEEV